MTTITQPRMTPTATPRSSTPPRPVLRARAPSAVGVERIADEADTTKKTIYDRFGSKAGLITALPAPAVRPVARLRDGVRRRARARCRVRSASWRCSRRPTAGWRSTREGAVRQRVRRAGGHRHEAPADHRRGEDLDARLLRAAARPSWACRTPTARSGAVARARGRDRPADRRRAAGGHERRTSVDATTRRRRCRRAGRDRTVGWRYDCSPGAGERGRVRHRRARASRTPTRWSRRRTSSTPTPPRTA